MVLVTAPRAAVAQMRPYGMVTHDLDRNRAGKMAELGAGFARISFRWWQIEPSPGVFNWTAADEYVWERAAPRGIRLFVSLGEPPEWAGGGTAHNRRPRDFLDWYRFVYAAVNRYKGYVKHWGIWNEPNLTVFLDDRASYQDIALWARKAIKDADPRAIVLGPEVSEHALDDGWFAQVMGTYGKDFFDIVTVHVYTGSLQRRMDEQVEPWRYGKEVWLTETGRQAFVGVELFERLQRDYFSSTVQVFEPRRWWWTRIFFYDLWAWDYGYRFGICRPDWTNQLAFDFYRDWIGAHTAVSGPGDVLTYDPRSGRWLLQGAAPGGGLRLLASGTWPPGAEVHGGDFNGDGFADVLWHEPGSGRWGRAINDGQGALTTEFTSTWTPGWEIHVVDLNADRRADVFLYDASNGFWFECLSMGDGDFVYLPRGLWSAGWQVSPGDLNGDGAGDLFLYNRTTGQWFRAINDRAGSFTYHTEVWDPGWDVHVGDFDGDRRADVFLYNVVTGQWFVCVSSGDTFRYVSGAWSPGWDVHLGDFNADARQDVFLYNRQNGVWFTATTRIAGIFDYVSGAWSPGWQVSVVDLNADRRSDILLYNGDTGGQVQVTTTVAPGAFRYESGFWSAGLTVAPTASPSS